MKKTITTVLILVSMASFGQGKKDSLQKKDTAFVPAFERMDTVKNVHIFYCGKDNIVKYSEKASVLLKGYAVKKGSDQWQWVDINQVQIIGALDENKKPVYKLIQILQK